MDTPERNQIGTPKAKFEDSPVFNYINSLSPIKPVKSVHITQTFSSLSFASLPSVFTSPHVSSHKESRFLRRHNPSDPSKSESSLESGNKVSTNEDAAELCINSAELHEDCVPGDSIGEASVEPRNEHSKFVIELPRNLKYDCGSPECGATTRCGTEAGCESEVADLSAPLVPYVQKTSENGSSDDGAHLQNICQSEQRNELTGCDWESLISGASDLLIFDSPNGSEPFRGIMQNPLDSVTRFCNSLMLRLSQNETADEQNVLVLDTIVSGEQPETEDPSSQYGEASQPEDTELMQDHLNSCMVSSQIEKEDNTVEAPMQFNCKPGLNLHRGLRRRCLDFEMVGARRKSLDNVPNSSSSMLSQSDEKITTNDKQLVPMKPGGESSRCILPGIGLHLNALATTSKDYKTIKHENMAYGRQLSLPNLTAPANSPTAGQGPGHESFSSASSERDMDGTDNGVQLLQDASQEPAFLANEEFNQNSPKKKRPKFEQAGETESSCKRCNCKKSKCLKLYCECFAAGVYCIEPCSCQECFNKPIHEDTVLATRKQIESRNPLAFAPKVIRNADPVPEYGEESSKTPASARHKRGCNCKKSSCLKKYCECYQGGVGCSISCRCEGCKNTFGRKDGSFMGTETEADEEEAESCGKSVAENRQQKNEIQENEEQHQDSALPTTPLRLSRQLVSLPFSSKNKPPRSSVFSIGSSSGLYTSQKLGILCPETKFERHIQAVPEDEMPEILQGDGSPSTGIKTASPNGKRVCPPNREFAPSPGRRAGRKLILQSIPSFPSLTPQN